LTGVRAGQPLSREIKEFGVPTLSKYAEGHAGGSVIRKLPLGPRAVEEPVHARSLHAREPGDPAPVRRIDR
jgi:hypothetical protein